VVVLRGAGPMFSSGMDLASLGELAAAPQHLRAFRGACLEAYNRAEDMAKPVVCEVHGACISGGMELALACDLRVMAADALIGMPETRIGLIPDLGGSSRLPQVVGLGRAKELVLTGRMIGAEEAERIGLVNRVAPPEELETATKALCDELPACAPAAFGLAKRVPDAGVSCASPVLNRREAAHANCRATPRRAWTSLCATASAQASRAERGTPAESAPRPPRPSRSEASGAGCAPLPAADACHDRRSAAEERRLRAPGGAGAGAGFARGRAGARRAARIARAWARVFDRWRSARSWQAGHPPGGAAFRWAPTRSRSAICGSRCDMSVRHAADIPCAGAWRRRRRTSSASTATAATDWFATSDCACTATRGKCCAVSPRSWTAASRFAWCGC
jgi:enoyl-CoA hydratase/carnithine racemase